VLHQLLNVASAVKQAVVRMQMKVGKLSHDSRVLSPF
jgi:hypothetical protein